MRLTHSHVFFTFNPTEAMNSNFLVNFCAWDSLAKSTQYFSTHRSITVLHHYKITGYASSEIGSNMYIYFIFVQTSYIAKDIDVGATLGFGYSYGHRYNISMTVRIAKFLFVRDHDRTNSQISIRTVYVTVRIVKFLFVRDRTNSKLSIFT